MARHHFCGRGGEMNSMHVRVICLAMIAAANICISNTASAQSSFAEVVKQTQPQMVKVYGAGGLRGLEAYQSGVLVSAEGHILTVWSYVLDSDVVTVMLDDGRK